jgi:S1-C subfamily serine protease
MDTHNSLARWIGVALFCVAPICFADLPETIELIKPSIVPIGVFQETGSPPFAFRGTGFVVGTGNLVVTNAHVIPESLDADHLAKLAIRPKPTAGSPEFRTTRLLAMDRDHDIAILQFEGGPLPALTLQATDTAREGQLVAFTGFPIGGALGFSPVTHRGSISAITPIVLPSANSQQLNEKSIRRLRQGSFDIMQLDATAYPGSSGSPVYDPENGHVIGIINMVFVKSTKEAVLSQPSGITYAIPVRFVRELLRTIH